MGRHFYDIFADDSGTVMVEYSLALALLSFISIWAFFMMAQTLYGLYSSDQSSLTSTALTIYQPSP